MEWHRKFGHLGNDNLCKLFRNNMIEGLNVKTCVVKNNPEEMIICESCLFGKQNRNKFSMSMQPRSTSPLELVHTDVCGPFPLETYDGKRYFVSYLLSMIISTSVVFIF